MKTYVLGISAFYHDSAACLLVDGDMAAAVQEERFSRKKHDHSFPSRSVSYCLREAGIRAEDLTHVAFYDKPFLKFERLLETYVSYAPRGLFSFIKAMPLWLRKKLWMGDLIRKELEGFEGKLLFPEHHQSHAASAFFPSPFERSAIITMDGVGEWATASWGRGEGSRVELLRELHFPSSLGLLYSAFTYHTGFRVNSGEYKLMGLAPYGSPKYKDLILEELVDLKEDGSFRMNLDFFNYCQGLTMTNAKFDELFEGPPRKPESELTQREMDMAASVQAVTEEIVLRTGRHVRKATGMKKLCLAGGVALNCVANGKLLREGVFEDIWIQPAAGDAGGALGAALFTHYQHLDNARSCDGIHDSQKGSLLGPAWSCDEIENWLEKEELPYRRMGFQDVCDTVTDALIEGKVVGWYSGRMEFGPRALGNRSILGDPRSPEMQSTINLKIKYRESFRPFAPSVLLERAPDYFQLEEPSPYMLLVAPVAESRRKHLTPEEEKLSGLKRLKVPRSDIPAVTHVDYSARVQTVDRERNPRYYKLLKEFENKTGCGLVINTSFNVRGEPIVCTPQDAYLCFMRTEMDILALDDCILLKEEQPGLDDERDVHDIFRLD